MMRYRRLLALAALLSPLACGPLGRAAQTPATAVATVPTTAATPTTPAPSSTVMPTDPAEQAYQIFPLATTVVTTAEMDGGARPEILFADGMFYIIYRDTLTEGGHFRLAVLDSELTPTGVNKVLVGSDEAGGVTDIRATSDGRFIYVAYQKSLPDGRRSLFLEKYSLAFERLASQHVTTARPEEEGTDDPALVLASQRLYLITRIGDEFRIREFDLELNPTGRTLETATGLIDEGPGGVVGVLFVDGYFYLVRRFGPGKNRDLVVLRFDADWQETGFRKVIAAEPDNEMFPTGFKYVDGRFYLTHLRHITRETEGFGPGQTGSVQLKVFDREFNLLAEIRVTDEGEQADHPTVEVVDDRIYVAYGHKEDSDAQTRSNVWVRVFQFISD